MLLAKPYRSRKQVVPYKVALLAFSFVIFSSPALAQGSSDGNYQPPPYQGQNQGAGAQVPVQESFAPPQGQYQPQQQPPAQQYTPPASYPPQGYQPPAYQPPDNGGGYPPQQAPQQGYPPQQPAQFGVNPPQQQYGGAAGGYPPQQQYGGGYPPQQGGYPPQYGGAPQYGGPQYGAPQGQFRQQGGVQYAQAGTVIACQLRTSISTQVAKEGDFIEASVSQPIPLGGYGSIPAGSVVSGQVASAEAGRRLSRSGELTIQFNSLRLPNGVTVPITAHLSGGAGKYKENNQGQFRGEGVKAKLGQTAIRGGLGAGLGAALGTGVGAIAGGGHGAGMGAWSGAAIGGGLGVGDMLLRKGRDVIIPSGTSMNVELDQPAAIPDANGTVQQPASQGVF